jgi:hypothetical protein
VSKSRGCFEWVERGEITLDAVTPNPAQQTFEFQGVKSMRIMIGDSRVIE